MSDNGSTHQQIKEHGGTGPLPTGTQGDAQTSAEVPQGTVAPSEQWWRASRGNVYIMTITNYLTRWANAYPLKDKTAASVCDRLGELVCQFGVPERIITDQGREFVNALNKELCHDLKIKHCICTAYHPQSNGLTERFNQTLERVLAKTVADDQMDWDVKLKWAVFSYCSGRQASSQQMPFFMTYGVEPRLAVEAADASEQPDTDWSAPDDDAIQRRLDALQQLPSIQRMGKQNIEKAQSKQKGIYDAKHKGTSYQVGDKILYYNSRDASRKGGKMNKKYLGPKVIVEVFENGTARLQGQKKLHSTKFFKIFRGVSPDDSSDDVLPITGNTSPISKGAAAQRMTATILPPKYVYRPPSVAWQRSMCARLGLQFVAKSAPHGRVIGTVFGCSGRPARLLNISGDNNCLFRALCYWITGAPNEHALIRKLICARMSDKKMGAYLKQSRMGADGTLGGHDEIEIMSELLDDLPIVTFGRHARGDVVQAWPWDVKSRVLDYSGLYLDWRAHHYQVVLSVKP